ncbi:putative cytokinetic ring protein SteA, partial [Nocardia gipuzkoensis]
MKVLALLSRNTETLPGLAGIARADRNTRRLLQRVGPGDIVVLDEMDLHRLTADRLVEAGVAAVLNASPSMSGRYPNLGPEVLVANGILLFDASADVFGRIKDGSKVRIDGGVIYADKLTKKEPEALVSELTELTEPLIAERMIEARTGLA